MLQNETFYSSFCSYVLKIFNDSSFEFFLFTLYIILSSLMIRITFSRQRIHPVWFFTWNQISFKDFSLVKCFGTEWSCLTPATLSGSWVMGEGNFHWSKKTTCCLSLELFMTRPDNIFGHRAVRTQKSFGNSLGSDIIEKNVIKLNFKIYK